MSGELARNERQMPEIRVEQPKHKPITVFKLPMMETAKNRLMHNAPSFSLFATPSLGGGVRLEAEMVLPGGCVRSWTTYRTLEKAEEALGALLAEHCPLLLKKIQEAAK